MQKRFSEQRIFREHLSKLHMQTFSTQRRIQKLVEQGKLIYRGAFCEKPLSIFAKSSIIVVRLVLNTPLPQTKVEHFFQRTRPAADSEDLFLIKLYPSSLQQKRLRHRFFPVNFSRCFGTAILQYFSERLFLLVGIQASQATDQSCS